MVPKRCVCVCVCVFVYVCICVCVYVYMYVCVCTCVHECVSVSVHVTYINKCSMCIYVINNLARNPETLSGDWLVLGGERHCPGLHQPHMPIHHSLTCSI